jgi:hypothetical protein
MPANNSAAILAAFCDEMSQPTFFFQPQAIQFVTSTTRCHTDSVGLYSAANGAALWDGPFRLIVFEKQTSHPPVNLPPAASVLLNMPQRYLLLLAALLPYAFF